MNNHDQIIERPNVERLNKFIANCGFASRRKVDELISSGRVSVNAKAITELGTRIDPDKDEVKVDGELIKPSQTQCTYILLFKPEGYITTTSDELDRPTVLDLIKVKERVYPVGRLDSESEGLLLLTNDGDLANKLMHPKYRVFKTYHVKINKPIDDIRLHKLRTGVKVDGKLTSKAVVKIIPDTDRYEMLMTIHEGRNRQIRKMFESLGLFVKKLKRIEYANLKIEKMKPGDWRCLTPNEISMLKRLTSDVA